MKKISVIVPVYNSELTIKKCVDSIINQSYKNIEIILINDGSTDNSLKMCNDLVKKNSNVIFINQENHGVSYSRNVGIELATGDYIGFVDSDDYIEKDMYKIMVENFDSKTSIVACNLFIEETTGKQLKNLNYHDCLIDRLVLPTEIYNNKSIQGYVCNKLYKSEIIKKNNIKFSEDYCVLEDDLFNYSILSYNEDLLVKYINKKLYHYVQTCTGASNSKFNIKKLSYLDVRIEEINILEKLKLENDYLKCDYICALNRMKLLSKRNKYGECFSKYENYSEKYKKEINIKNINGKLKFKYLIIRYLPFIYYCKILIKKEK